MQYIYIYMYIHALRGLSPRANYIDRATAVVGKISANFFG
jgi:hypothetical protein